MGRVFTYKRLFSKDVNIIWTVKERSVKWTAFYGKYNRDHAACHKNAVKLLKLN